MKNHFLRTVTQGKSVLYVTDATALSASVTIPATAQAGDIAFLVNTGNDNTTSTAPPLTNQPSGWTLVNNVSATNAGAADATRSKLYVRVLTSGDPGATVTGASGVSSTRMTVLIFRPNYSVSTITTASVNSFGTTNSSSINETQTVDVSTLSEPIVIIAFAFCFSTVSGFTMNPTETGTYSVSTTSIKYAIQNSSKQNVSTTYSQTSPVATLVSFAMNFS